MYSAVPRRAVLQAQTHEPVLLHPQLGPGLAGLVLEQDALGHDHLVLGAAAARKRGSPRRGQGRACQDPADLPAPAAGTQTPGYHLGHDPSRRPQIG